jgi:hypothetical protein
MVHDREMGNSNQIVKLYLTPLVMGVLPCGCVTKLGQASSEPTGNCAFVKFWRGKSSNAPS